MCNLLRVRKVSNFCDMRWGAWRVEDNFDDLFRDPIYKDWMFWAFGVWEFFTVIGGVTFLVSSQVEAFNKFVSFIFGFGFFTFVGLIPVRSRYKRFLVESRDSPQGR
jgi:hypothetical protein